MGALTTTAIEILIKPLADSYYYFKTHAESCPDCRVYVRLCPEGQRIYNEYVADWYSYSDNQRVNKTDLGTPIPRSVLQSETHNE